MAVDDLVTIEGNLLDAYNQLQPGTMLHVDQLTTERRTNNELRKLGFYTADGELYSSQFWAITRQPQNLILKHIDKPFTQFRTNGNYLPNSEEALASVQHPDTVVIDPHGLRLIKDYDECGHFVVDPRNPKNLNSQQELAAMRIFGPDEENYGKNLEMFAEAGKTPWVFVLMPDYVQNSLKQKNAEYLARASWLFHFDFNSRFNASDWSTGGPYRFRGYVRGA